jgi:hypothetical protein
LEAKKLRGIFFPNGEISPNLVTLPFHSTFFVSLRCDYGHYAPQLIRALILLFTCKDEVVLQQAWNALAAVTKNMDADQQVGQIR